MEIRTASAYRPVGDPHGDAEDFNSMLGLAGFAPRPPLTPTEETELARRMAAGDSAARQYFIESNLKLVLSICQRYRGSGLPMEDIIMEGSIGLIEAVDRFDHQRGLRFSTCAVPWIEGKIRRAIQKKSMLHVPLRVASHLYRLGKVRDELFQEYRRDPTATELAMAMRLPEERVQELQSVPEDPLSVDQPIDGNEETVLADLVVDEDAEDPMETAMGALARHYFCVALRGMRQRDRDILVRRFGLDGHPPHTLSEIARMYGLTRTRVKQIEDAALRKARALIAD